MKLNKIIYVVPLAVLILAAGAGCRKGQFNVNRNINNPTDSSVTYDVVLPAAMNATGRIVASSWGPIQNWMSYWSRSGTYAPNVTEETYQITTGFGNGIWNSCYDNNYDYNIVKIKAGLAGAGFYEGIARIMMAHNYQILVDVYGNVPYSQALKGSGNPTPAYDKGLDIYKALLREIDAGILLIRRANVTATNPNKNIATNDIMFQGDKTKWVRFANTLKLRMLIHCYAVGAIDKAVEMNIINTTVDTTAGNAVYGFIGAGQDAQINPGYTGVDKGNPFYNTYKFNTDGSASANDVYYKANEWGIEYYKADGDPRVTNAVVAGAGSRTYVAGTGGMIGVKYGLPPITANASTVLAGIGPGVYRSATSPQCVISAAESFFLQAEARFRGWITSGSSAQTLNENGIKESFTFLGVPNPTTTSFTGYMTYNAGFPDVDYTAGPIAGGAPGGGLYTILSCKWFAMNGINTLETWCDWRRVPYSDVATKVLSTNTAAPTTNFVYGDGAGYSPGPFRSVAPQITPADNIPVRYLYPQAEYNYNTANVAAEGTITRYSKVFWDVN
jgi:hypothetical protein